MTDSKDKNPLYRGPGQKPDQARGARPPRRDAERSGPRTPRFEREEARSQRPHREAPRHAAVSDSVAAGGEMHPARTTHPARPKEFRIYGLNACLAAFKNRPGDIRKVWLLESRIPKLGALLAFCVKNRIGYNVVESEDLEKLTGSAHHEGVCLAVPLQAELPLSSWLMTVPAGPCLLIWLDGVGNPHNLGAILRSAAHFGAAAVLLPKHSELANSGAAARVAEGGAEYVPLVRLGRNENSIAQLKSAGFELVTTVVRGGGDLFKTALPKRCVLVMGAEQIGVDAELLAASALKLEIPGTGKVESLNVSAAAAVLLAEWRRQLG